MEVLARFKLSARNERYKDGVIVLTALPADDAVENEWLAPTGTAPDPQSETRITLCGKADCTPGVSGGEVYLLVRAEPQGVGP